MGSKKGFWTLTRIVKVTYTAREDFSSDDYDEPITLKTARKNADCALEDVNSNSDFNGMTFEPVAGTEWKEEDFEVLEDED